MRMNIDSSTAHLRSLDRIHLRTFHGNLSSLLGYAPCVVFAPSKLESLAYAFAQQIKLSSGCGKDYVLCSGYDRFEEACGIGNLLTHDSVTGGDASSFLVSKGTIFPNLLANVIRSYYSRIADRPEPTPSLDVHNNVWRGVMYLTGYTYRLPGTDVGLIGNSKVVADEYDLEWTPYFKELAAYRAENTKIWNLICKNV